LWRRWGSASARSSATPGCRPPIDRSVRIASASAPGAGAIEGGQRRWLATDTQAACSFSVNPKSYGNRFTVQMRAYDRAGNLQYTAKRTYRR
jgi:hypothetical protein